jgi:hypothetical protein
MEDLTPKLLRLSVKRRLVESVLRDQSTNLTNSQAAPSSERR